MKYTSMRTVVMALALLSLPAASTRSYPVDDDAVQNEVVLEAREKLTPDLTSPPVRFAIRNRDPQTGIFYTLDEGGLEGAGTWQIQIFDRRGRKVSFVQGEKNPPPLVSWSGTSYKGEPLPDGFYTATFGWRDPGGKFHTTKPVSFTLLSAMEIRGLADWKLRFQYTDEGLALSIAESMIFRPGESLMQQEALPAMLQIALFLKTCKANMVTVRGYTDSSGSPSSNRILARERANSVYRYLVEAGIDPGRLTYEGTGAAGYVASNATEAGRARNRRVEVVVLKTLL